ncbi:hypothetical protein FJTKL_06980 [Diaporthe vaccinii]|uniref:Uncharacterized protein n=1 Tax=Diaporthe vaccinii TaxID=105482 RepID=A0ABR4DPH6_9PEZI
MAIDKNFEHYESAKVSTNLQATGKRNHRRHGALQPACRRRPSMAAIVIIAIALALLLAAVIVIGTTRLQTSTNDQPSDNTTPSQSGPPPSPASTQPPGGDQGLSWCQIQGDGNCTLGVYQNLDSGQIRAQVFDHTCRPLGSSDHIKLESTTALNSSLPETVVLLIHGITGPIDEFWYNGTRYTDGWVWQNPAPVWYETQSFPCL